MNLEHLQQAYEEHKRYCGYAVNTAKARIENLEHHLETVNNRNFIDSITSRVKTFDSAVEKFNRKGYKDANGKPLPLTIENLLSRIKDVGGIRIITMLKSDAYEVSKKIEEIFPIAEKIDYIANPKENGYQSIHLMIQVQVDVDRPRMHLVEIQIRTLAMNVWSTLDHYFNYKKDTDPEAMKTFKAMSDQLNKFEAVAEELHQSLLIEDTTVAKPEKTPQTKPKKAN